MFIPAILFDTCFTSSPLGNAHNIQCAQSCVANVKRHSCFRSQPGVYITIFTWKYREALQVSHVHVFCARYIWFCSCWPKKGSLPEAQLKFSIIIKPKEISINGGRFSKKHIPFIIVDRTAKQEVNVILNFTELTQQTKSVLLWGGIPRSLVSLLLSHKLEKILNWKAVDQRADQRPKSQLAR